MSCSSYVDPISPLRSRLSGGCFVDGAEHWVGLCHPGDPGPGGSKATSVAIGARLQQTSAKLFNLGGHSVDLCGLLRALRRFLECRRLGGHPVHHRQEATTGRRLSPSPSLSLSLSLLLMLLLMLLLLQCCRGF